MGAQAHAAALEQGQQAQQAQAAQQAAPEPAGAV
jgi:hypothetical protein